MNRFGTWLIGVAVATTLAAFIGVIVFAFSYYQQFSFNSDGYYTDHPAGIRYEVSIGGDV